MSGNYPDDVTQEMVDRAAGGYEGYYCNFCEERVDDEHECPGNEPQCSCVACEPCEGRGVIQLTHQYDEPSAETCPDCRGRGIEKLCEACANEPADEDLYGPAPKPVFDESEGGRG